MTSATAAIAAEGLRRREAETVEVTEREVPLPEWPSTLDGFRVLVVSDLHLPPEAKGLGRRDRRLAALLAQTPCDVLTVPGDCANTEQAARAAVELFSHARARHGIFITLGNGEHKRPEETLPIVRELRRAGRVLMNEHVRIHIGAQPLWMVGVDDPSEDRDRLGRAARNIPPGQPTILLAHSPEIVTRLHRAAVDLVVCGHTHGGQICPPSGRAVWTQTASLERSSLGYGLYGPEDFARYNPMPMERTRMFVTRGVGTAKLAVRAFCRPEIALLTLRSAPAANR
jgi:predicted MPP superfamily phosphohydrolase